MRPHRESSYRRTAVSHARAPRRNLGDARGARWAWRLPLLVLFAALSACDRAGREESITAPHPPAPTRVDQAAALSSAAVLSLQVAEIVDSNPSQSILTTWMQNSQTASLLLSVNLAQDIAICPPSTTRSLPFTFFDLAGSPGTAVFDIAPMQKFSDITGTVTTAVTAWARALYIYQETVDRSANWVLPPGKATIFCTAKLRRGPLGLQVTQLTYLVTKVSTSPQYVGLNPQSPPPDDGGCGSYLISATSDGGCLPNGNTGGAGGGGSGGAGASSPLCTNEFMVIEVSNDGGATWTVLWAGTVRVCG